MIKAVLFDLDGTLVNSLADLANAVNIGLEKFGFPCHETDEFKYFVGDGIAKMIERALPEEQRNADNLEDVKKIFFDYYSIHYADETRAYNGMPELVNELKNRGLLVAVVTNKAQNMADIVVKGLYGDVFDLIFGQRDGVPAKPDPTLTLLAMDSLGVKPEECVFLGDSGMDVATGVNSGAVPVGELWGFRLEDELLENGARFIIKSPDELIPLIERLDSQTRENRN